MSSEASYFLLAAHQLRSPLASMQTVIKILLETGVADEKKAISLLEQLDERCGNMLEMVNDLLNLGEAGKQEEIPAEGANAEEILQDVIKNLEPVAAKKSLIVKLEANDCPAVKISPVALEHICMNIVENAVKYGKDGGNANISARAEGESFLLEVRDDGIGIPGNEIDYIFNEFHRADNAKRLKKQGTGLGLAIVKKFVDNAGGSISVKSAEGEGTTFTVRLPAIKS